MMEDLVADFERATSKLRVDEDVVELSKKIIDRCGVLTPETLSSSQSDDVKRLAFACVLYLGTKVRARESATQANGISLREILLAFDISIADFLQELPATVKVAMPTLSMMFGDEVESRLGVRDLQTAFVHSLVLGKKARDLFQKFCNLPAGTGEHPAPVLRLTWLLFILAKAELLGAVPDLVTSFNLLVCVVNVIVAHLPRALGTVDFSDQTLFPVRTEAGAANTLASIALVSKTSSEEVRPLAAILDLLMQERLGGVIPADRDFSFPDGKVEASRTGFPGLLGDPGCEAALRVLDEQYEKVYRTVSEIDERSFIKRREAEAAATTFAGTGSIPSLSKCQVGTPIRNNSLSVGTPLRLISSPLRPANYALKTPSPVRTVASSYFATPTAVPGTPVTESMQLAAWLRETSAKQSAQPSQVLHAYFKACDEDVTATVVKRAQELSNAIFPLSSGPAGEAYLQSTRDRERRLAGTKVYYRVLESMLRAEEARTGKQNFTALLQNEVFHKCLLACAFEMVVASYRIVTLTFPAVLERLKLKAFDLCKLIETFVRHEPLLPRELKRHMFSIEEKMLEALAWERNSTLFPKLVVACNDIAAAPGAQRQGEASATPEGSRNASGGGAGAAASPVKSADGESGGEGETTPSKRSLEGSPETSPPKLQKGSNEQRVQPVPTVEGADAPSSPAEASPGARVSPISITPGAQRPTSGLFSPQRHSNTSAFSAFMSPMRPGSGEASLMFGPLPAAFGAPSEHLERPGRAVIADFLRKVLKLGLLRLADLCERMEFEPLDRQDILTQAYTMVQHVVYEQTHLLYNRHIDQILLSALYGVCKVNSLKQITFKEIIQHYKKQPQAKTEIFRTVVITQSDPDLMVSQTGDIIEFYNAVFIPTVKSFVLKLGSRKAPLIRPPSLSLGTARRTLMSPAAAGSLKAGFATPPPAAERTLRGLSPSGKVYVSPLRQSPKQPFLTPRARMIYAGRMGESAHAYQSPSKDLKYINSRIAAHSQQPIVIPAAMPAAAENNPAGGTQAQGPTSSDHSCSSGGSSGIEPSHSNSRYSEPLSSTGHLLRQSSNVTSRAGGGLQEQERSGLSALNVMARAASHGGRAGSAHGGSGLEDLHNAALLLGHDEGGLGGLLGNAQPTRRSRRQAGRAPRD